MRSVGNVWRYRLQGAVSENRGGALLWFNAEFAHQIAPDKVGRVQFTQTAGVKQGVAVVVTSGKRDIFTACFFCRRNELFCPIFFRIKLFTARIILLT